VGATKGSFTSNEAHEYHRYDRDADGNYIPRDRWAPVEPHRRGKCEICGDPPAPSPHHLTYKRYFAEEGRDLAVLCRFHHKQCHHILEQHHPTSSKDAIDRVFRALLELRANKDEKTS
jgi:hypothetical protein